MQGSDAITLNVERRVMEIMTHLNRLDIEDTACRFCMIGPYIVDNDWSRPPNFEIRRQEDGGLKIVGGGWWAEGGGRREKKKVEGTTEVKTLLHEVSFSHYPTHSDIISRSNRMPYRPQVRPLRTASPHCSCNSVNYHHIS